jgi:hypothetical protein
MPSRYHAFTRLVDKSFEILIDKDADQSAQLMLLIHEVAHVLSWHADKHPSEHGKHFGIAYSKAWRMYLPWMELDP